MPYVNIKLVEGVFDDDQKQEMLSRVTETMVDIEGEALRPVHLVTHRRAPQRRLVASAGRRSPPRPSRALRAS